jgi:hypothetical protein
MSVFEDVEVAFVEVGYDVLLVVDDGGVQDDLFNLLFEYEDAGIAGIGILFAARRRWLIGRIRRSAGRWLLRVGLRLAGGRRLRWCGRLRIRTARLLGRGCWRRRISLVWGLGWRWGLGWSLRWRLSPRLSLRLSLAERRRGRCSSGSLRVGENSYQEKDQQSKAIPSEHSNPSSHRPVAAAIPLADSALLLSYAICRRGPGSLDGIRGHIGCVAQYQFL